MSNLWVREKESTNFCQKMWLNDEMKNLEKGINLPKSAYGAEIENFIIRTKMALARPILELDL